MPEDVIQAINGFGTRLNDLALAEAGCRERTDQRLKRVESDCEEKHEQITRIFQSQETTAVAIAEIKSTIRTWGLALGILSPILAAIVSAIISKYI